MKLALFSLCIVLAASAASAREVIANVQVKGGPALIYDDGFWRFDDEVGEVCTPTGKHGEVCALPSVWSRLPDVDESRYDLPEFVQGEYLAEFSVLQRRNGTLDLNNVLAFIGNQTMHDGLRGLALLSTEGSIGNLDGKHVVVSAGANGVFAFTFANQNGRFLIAQTRDQNSTIYHSGHQKAHESFVQSLYPAPFDSGQE
ncbi:hypothetical protein MWU53_09530 [Aliiroseovarius sp. S1123]|uniref:hypothetical protein n=1 Tax=unclassified Aliiroseovarius TaxID=2623558 RepID=UPI001FF55F6A|nr:hypothetical protein [Aliiroseovarius sp. S1123]MCK0171296.1 hypothetical protein [Aliiroseovarius sp. S1123]